MKNATSHIMLKIGNNSEKLLLIKNYFRGFLGVNMKANFDKSHMLLNTSEMLNL